MTALLRTLVTFSLLSATVVAKANDAEIESLIQTVASSDCTFYRNGTAHPSEQASDHLRRKWRRGKIFVNSTEQFIERIASKSTLSRQPYRVQCRAKPAVETGVWLRELLSLARVQ